MVLQKVISFFSVFVFVTIFNLSAINAQDATNDLANEPIYRVSVTVSAKATFQNTLHTYLLRELRQVNDVLIVNRDDADLKIQVVSLRTSSGVYAASVVVLSLMNIGHLVTNIPFFLKKTESRFFSEETWEGPGGWIILAGVDEYFKDLFHETGLGVSAINLHTIYTDPELRSLAERIVADIDIDVFEIMRQAMRQVQNK